MDDEDYKNFMHKLSIHRVIENAFLAFSIVFILVVYAVLMVQNVSLRAKVHKLSDQMAHHYNNIH